VETTLLFSGGVDSTLAAVLLVEKFDRVRLVTYNHGWRSGHFSLNRSRRRAREVRRKLGADRISFDYVHMGPLFRRFVTATLLDDYRRFRSNTCCVGCKLAMHARTVLYNLRRGIGHVADGSTADQAFHAEQLSGVLAGVRCLYAHYGIEYANPGFDLDLDRRKARLIEAGFKPKGIQPRCLIGAYDFFIHTPLHVAHHQEEDTMMAYMEYKLPMAFAIIEEIMAAEGLAQPAPA